jgi:hypothetical protein
MAFQQQQQQQIVAEGNFTELLLPDDIQAIAPNPHTNLLYVYVYIQLANKMAFQQQQQQIVAEGNFTELLLTDDMGIYIKEHKTDGRAYVWTRR